MEFADYLSSIASGLILIVGYFLKKVLSDVEALKKSEMENSVLKEKVANIDKHIVKNEETMFKKFANIHAKQDIQNEMNTEFKTMLVSINTKLDFLVDKKKN